MADEDELFAQFMGEIKNTVVESVDDGGDTSDAASVGGVEERDTIADDTAKRKAGTEALPSSAAKKLKVAGKLVAAALPMKANAASAAAPKTASSRTDAWKSGANSVSPTATPTTVNGGGVEDGATGGTEWRKDGVSPHPGKMQGVALGASSAGEKLDVGDSRRGNARTGRVGDGNGVDGAGGKTRPAVNGVQNIRSGALISERGLHGVARGAMGMHHPHMTGGRMPGNGGMGMNPRGGELGMGMNMGMMAGNGGGGYGAGYGMPPGMAMNMGMEMAMGVPPGMGLGPYPGGAMGYGFDAGMAGVVPMSGGGTEAAAMGGKGKQPTDSGAKAFKRVAGGKSWKDETLADWPENDYRLFVGDLGNEVTDEHLAGAFRKYASFAKARVIREKWNKKSKGYGFISFVDGMDMLKALREQNGKYLGNRPMKISKSTWKDRDAKEVKKRNKKAKKVKKQLGML